MTSVSLFAVLQHRVARGLELVARLPVGILGRLRDTVANGEKHLQVFDGAAQVPIGLNHVARLVVVVLGVVVSHLLAVLFRGLADEVRSFIRIERGDTLFGEVK